MSMFCTINVHQLNYKILAHDNFSLLLTLWLEVKGSHTEGEMNFTLREEARPHFGRACKMGGVCAGIVENAVCCMCYSRTSALQWLTSTPMKMYQHWGRSYFDVRDLQPSTELNSLQLWTKKVPWGCLGQGCPTGSGAPAGCPWGQQQRAYLLTWRLCLD